MGIIRFAIRNPITVAVGVILVALFGLVSIRFVPIQLTPDIDRPRATVFTTWPGASPFEVEREIIDEQEEALKGLDGLRELESESHHSTRKVIDHHTDPPTEGPRLRQSERNPRNPEAGSGWYGGQIDVPDITGMSGRDN